MPQLMPYHLEKGPTVRLLEQHTNGTADEMRAALDGLRNSVGSVDWVFNAMPSLWEDPVFAHHPLGSGKAVQEAFVRNWLGFEDSGGQWTPGTGDTTGYWVAYKGDVNEIVRRTLQWALENALGLGPRDTGPGRDDPWPIEIFWKCPTPWFEGWVVTRPVETRSPCDGEEAKDGPRTTRLDDQRRHRWLHRPEREGGAAHDEDRGLVTVVFMSPAHIGANVAESPVATSALTMPPGFSYAIPSWEDDYEVLGEQHPDPTGFPNRPEVTAIERHFSQWVVTHRNHVTTGVLNVTEDTTAAADFADWGIPQLSVYEGRDDIVVVSPSVPAGGVPQDGEL